jgi:branched-chain amino acid transport system permease protein
MYLASIILQNLVLGTQILMVAVCLYLVSSASRIIHLATGAIGAAGAYGLYWGISQGWPIWIAVLFAFAVSILLGVLSSKILESFAARREPLLGLIVSFALGMVIESLIAILFGTDGKSLEAGILSTVHFGAVELDIPGVITIIFGILLAILAWGAVEFTKAGRLLRGVAENPTLSAAIGVSNKKIRRIAYAFSACVAAAVIILTGWHTALTPSMGFQLVVAAFIALLMGGVHDLRGTAIASYAIAIIPGIIIAFTEGFSENWRLVFAFCIAAAVLAFRPRGIFSKQIREA